MFQYRSVDVWADLYHSNFGQNKRQDKDFSNVNLNFENLLYFYQRFSITRKFYLAGVMAPF